MKNRKTFRLSGILLSALMALLLSFPRISLEGARNGLLLWYQTVLPTLLPFMVCTNLLISMQAVRFLTAPAAPLFRLLFGLSDSGCFILLCGMLCGYPMGAKTCSDFLDQGCLPRPEAQSLYAVSSFPSPMFLAGFMAAKAPQVPFWKLAAAVYLPVIPLFFCASRIYGFSSSTNRKPQPEPPAEAPADRKPSLPLDEALMSSIEVMVKIGGYLMMFSILASFLKRIPFPGHFLPALLLSAAEMTTGMEEASRTVTGFPCALLVLWAGTFGGFSGIFQVKSVTKNAGLSIRHYVLWKLLHSLLSCLILTLLSAVLP